jgi:hypothetical protein
MFAPRNHDAVRKMVDGRLENAFGAAGAGDAFLVQTGVDLLG